MTIKLNLEKAEKLFPEGPYTFNSEEGVTDPFGNKANDIIRYMNKVEAYKTK